MTSWLIETFVATTLLMLVALLLRAPVARAFGARWAYALWLIPALRVILPPLPALLPKATLPPVVIIIPATARLTAPQSTNIAPNWEWMPFLAALWVGGAVIFLTLQWLDYRQFLHRLDRTSRPSELGSADGIRMLVSPEVDGPVALGLLDRKIVLPGDFSRRYSPSEQRLAIEHELIHHRRGDLWWNLAALLILAFNWFNPVAWFAFRAFRSDQELACDAAVAARVSTAARHDYATALVKAASRPGLIAVCPLTRVGQLKHRLRMMALHRHSPWRSIGGTACVSALAASAFLLGTPGFSHQAERQIVYRLAAAPAPASMAAARPAFAAPEAPSPPLALAAVPARPHHRHASTPAVKALPPPPVVVAAATPIELPETRLSLPRLPRLAPVAPRAPRAPVVRVYGASMTTAPTVGVQQKIDRVEQILSRIHHGDGEDMRRLQAIIEQMHGEVTIKVVHAFSREDEA